MKLPLADGDDTLTIVRRLLADNAYQHRRRYAIAFVLMALAGAATSAIAYLFGTIINQAYTNRDFPAVVALGFVAFLLFATKGGATYGSAVLMSRIGARIVADNQRRMFDKLLNEGLRFFDNRHSSEFIARLTTGAYAANSVINLLIVSVGRDLLTLIGLVVVMVIQDPIMSTLGLVVMPPALLFLRKLIRRIRNIARSQFTGGARIIETMQEMVQGVRVVKAFTLEAQMRRRFEESVGEVERESVKMARVANRSSPLMETLGGLAVAGATVYCGYRVIHTGAAPGEFFSFMAAFLLAYEPAKRLSRLNIDLNSQLVGVRVLFEILDSPATEPLDDHLPPLKLTTARVEFDKVAFSYRPDEPVLRAMSFVAEPGKVTALVGPSGGGKSTVLNLLLRYYEIESGAITIDGQDIAGVSRRSLRRQIGLVGQNVHLFAGSIGDNIAIGKDGATEAEIVAAARAAHAHEFIMNFPDGYATEVGEHGVALSGGQRQRIAIARALIKNAPIILLDEATAALDSESEKLVQQAIAELCRGRTTIVVAHRLATIMHADRILVIENGGIAETGRHDDLLRLGGRYASFHRLQLQHEAEAPAHAAG
jgi:subfamily B ATP-binding cassette protein MsbA